MDTGIRLQVGGLVLFLATYWCSAYFRNKLSDTAWQRGPLMVSTIAFFGVSVALFYAGAVVFANALK